MAAFKDKKNGSWYVQFRYTDWRGERQQKLKRGFSTKKEAQAWEREFLMQKQADVNMSFESFVALYEKDVKPRLKLNTWLSKEHIIREGELLALTPADFDFEKKTLRINKSYQRLQGKNVITTPKTKKSNRVIQMPDFLCDEMQDYFKQLYGLEPDSRIFPLTKHTLKRGMEFGCKASGVKVIRIHDLRHSHVSLLINMGYSAVAIGNRVGHESVEITYRYAHLFPTVQKEMADKLNVERSN